MSHPLRKPIGTLRKALHRPHRHLSRRWGWYARWHDHPASDRSHGTIVITALFASGTLVAQAAVGLHSTIQPSTPTVNPPQDAPPARTAGPGTAQPVPVARQCGDRSIVTETVGTPDNPIRFESPFQGGRWVLVLAVVPRSVAFGSPPVRPPEPVATPSPEPTPGTSPFPYPSLDPSLSPTASPILQLVAAVIPEAAIVTLPGDCAAARLLTAAQPVAVDLSGIRIDLACESCSTAGIRLQGGVIRPGDRAEHVVAFGDGRAHGQWELSGIRISRLVGPGGWPYGQDTEPILVFSLINI